MSTRDAEASRLRGSAPETLRRPFSVAVTACGRSDRRQPGDHASFACSTVTRIASAMSFRLSDACVLPSLTIAAPSRTLHRRAWYGSATATSAAPIRTLLRGSQALRVPLFAYHRRQPDRSRDYPIRRILPRSWRPPPTAGIALALSTAHELRDDGESHANGAKFHRTCAILDRVRRR